MGNVQRAGASHVQPKNHADVSANSGDSEGDRPTFQNYFFLAPNVRFTRTPDREIGKPRDDDADLDTPASQAVDIAAAAAAPVVTVARSAPATVVDKPAFAETPRSAARQAAAAERCVEPIKTVQRQSAPASAREAAPAETHVVADRRWANISDHAFFEFAAENLVDVPAASAPATALTPLVRAEPVAKARIAASALQNADITTLYRVVECAVTDKAFYAQPQEAEPVVVAAVDPLVVEDEVKVEESRQEAVANQPTRSVEITMPAPRAPSLPMAGRVTQVSSGEAYEFPSEELLQEAPEGQGYYMSQERLEQNADLLESVLEDFGVKGEIIHVRPGPVVTLYEFEPAPGVKSSRVINLAEDIARSMSAISARVAVVPGRNVIGIELPNETRETVYFRELIESQDFRKSSARLALCLGKTIGGEPVIAELAKMPHLLVAGTTGSGKSVAINTMILSLLYRLKPEECRLIMVDPKMLELSVYDGIPHLLTPVVTDPKKAVTALKWAVREMEDRYRKMAKLGVRNIDGYNQRATAARDKGEIVVMQVQTGFEKGTGEPTFEDREIDLAPMPYIVVIVDEMADLMMVAGKEIEGAIQRLAQMARAAGIHLIMATQRPSVDVITGTIKANFPTRISFQVTSKIDSRTILGEQGAEQLLGQGDMLHMAGGGRVARVHGPFVSDDEVEQVVAHLKTQGRPEYLETVTADEDDEEEEVDEGAVFDKGAIASEDDDGLFEEAVKVVMRDKKCSTSYIQRRLGVGYNRAASLVERMEKEGFVGAANHVGKREILMGKADRGAD
ncbi:DNA translocase FtsK [Mesorhizobium sp. BAC0120]|uniref:DNA translocase FtsK n=1 Tax=Mesorhizobium sp. BAC0120 TaxID=3090670 RepID=UPI00298C0603|nr:DNA translocase FtsK [Mesorhizobium sp. BAC0120]MDW6024208.1 DNA translocase FtsK [Mesorhizobium sp. BAC0120]